MSSEPVKAGRHSRHSTSDARAPSDSPPPAKYLLVFLLAAAAFVAVIAVHWPVLSAKAVSINDGMYVTHNPLVLQPGWHAAGRFLGEVRKPSTVQGYYQPLTMISLMLDTLMGGNGEYLRPYHRTSLAIHALNTALIVVLLYLLLGEPWSAAFAGLLFGLHPMTVETMAWSGERKTLLATSFALLCLISYVRYTRRPRALPFAASLGLFVLALMSKPTVTPLPAAMLLLDFWPLRRLGRQAVIEKIPFFLLAGVFAAITIISQQHFDISAHHQTSTLQHLMLIAHNLVFYPLKMIWPAPLSSVYPFPEPIGVSNPMVALGLAATALMIAATIISLHWTRALAVSWLIFLVMLAPTLLNIDYAMGVAADKYAYLPAVGFLLMLAWALGGAMRRPTVWRWAAAVSVLALSVVEANATRHYLTAWRDTETLCQHILHVAPNTEWAHSELAGEYLEKNRVADAFEHAERALQIAPRSHNAHSAMGEVLIRQGKPDQAISHFEQAIAAKPDLSEAYANLAICLAATHHLDRAIEVMREALKLNSGLPQAHFNIALMLLQDGQPAEAKEHLRAALTLKPDYPEAHYRLGDLLAQQGDSRQAIQQYREALRNHPDEPAILMNLGIELARAGQLPEATQYLRRTVALAPDWPDAHGNLAHALAQADKTDEAIAELREVLRLSPASASAHAILGDLLAHQGHTEAAIREYQAALLIDPSHAGARTGLDAAIVAKQPATQNAAENN